jgi:hypothetical protein
MAAHRAHAEGAGECPLSRQRINGLILNHLEALGSRLSRGLGATFHDVSPGVIFFNI